MAGLDTHLLARLERAETFHTIRERATAEVGAPSAAVKIAQLHARELVAGEGYASIRVLSASESGFLMALTRLLRAEGLPATFLYVFDETWNAAHRLATALAPTELGAFEVLDDGYAFWIGGGERGWPAHRGIYTDVRDAAQTPTVLNTWFALADTTPDNACMYCLPIPEDPNYPHALARLDGPIDRAVAMPVRAGEALVWDANLLHWGGRAKPHATPRVSVTFTLATTGSATHRDLGPAPTANLSSSQAFTNRLAFVARQLTRYQANAHNLPETLRKWALMLSALPSRQSK